MFKNPLDKLFIMMYNIFRNIKIIFRKRGEYYGK